MIVSPSMKQAWWIWSSIVLHQNRIIFEELPAELNLQRQSRPIEMHEKVSNLSWQGEFATGEESEVIIIHVQLGGGLFCPAWKRILFFTVCCPEQKKIFSVALESSQLTLTTLSTVVLFTYVLTPYQWPPCKCPYISSGSIQIWFQSLSSWWISKNCLLTIFSFHIDK